MPSYSDPRDPRRTGQAPAQPRRRKKRRRRLPVPGIVLLLFLAGGGAETVDVGAGEGLAPAAAAVDEPGPLERRDVLLHCREADRVAPGQGGDRLLLRERPAQDVAPGAVRERMEPGIGPVLVARSHAMNLQPNGCESKGWISCRSVGPPRESSRLVP